MSYVFNELMAMVFLNQPLALPRSPKNVKARIIYLKNNNLTEVINVLLVEI